MIRALAGGLAARLTLTMILALLAAQVSSFLLFLAFRPRPMPVYTAESLAAAVESVVHGAAAADGLHGLTIERATTAPMPANPHTPPQLRSVRRALEARLGEAAERVMVWEERDRGGPRPGLPGMAGAFGGPGGPPGPEGPRPDRPPPDQVNPNVPPGFAVAVLRPGSDWLVVKSAHGQPGRSPLLLPGLSFVIAGLVVAGLSIWSARRIVAPLGRLTEAARRLGMERAAAPVAEAGPMELRAIARAFNEMSARLTRFVGDRTQMVAAISHDLRTPLTRMRLRAEEIDDPEARRRMLGDIAEMESMIDATLSFAGQESETEPHRRVDLAGLLIGLCDDRVDAGQRADYTGPDHMTVRCQPVAMRRALANLLDNACNHGAAAHVALSEEARGVTVRITDEGPGIPPQRVEEAFAPFRRLEPSRNRATGGVGLGLTVARTILRAHGGDVVLSNANPRGLVATVILPRAA